MTHKICPDCGASLDFNETCDCKSLPVDATETTPPETKPAESETPKMPLIFVKQLPIIEEQLHSIKDAFIRQTDDALSLVCNEDTLAAVKKRRAAITKVFNDLETRRKEVKKKILAPYDKFENVYRECVTDIYNRCDQMLAGKISAVEDGLRDEKRAEAEDYFNELCQSRGIDFLTLDRAGINIIRSISMKKIKEQILSFVDRVSDDLKLINTQTHPDEILVEYKQSLNVANAITTVTNRHYAIEQERLRKEAAAEEEKRRAEAEAKVEEAIAQSEPEAFAPPIETPVEEPSQTDEKIFAVKFTVRGTKEKIKELKKFLDDNKYDYK